jgi:hypothetical protein
MINRVKNGGGSTAEEVSSPAEGNVTPMRDERWWKSDRALLGYLLLAILAVKFAILAFDSYPRFLMGDSASYLYTALTGWIPEDRSFTYGFLIRPLTVFPHSLIPLVVFQTLLGAISAWIGGYCLRLYFKAPFWIAAVCALACAIEPLQLLSERFVLTESVSTFLFSVVVWLSLAYLRSAGLVLLLAIQVVSVALISIRISYLPVVLANSVLLPLLGPTALSLWKAIRRKEQPPVRMFRLASSFAVHFLVAVLVSQAALYGYRQWNGYLNHRPPAYNYKDGLFLASFWAPVIEPRDFPIPELRAPIFDHLTFDLADPTKRNNQCFSQGGLVPQIIKETTAKFGGDGLTYPNKLAKKTALRAAKRNPLGLLHLFWVTAEEYFDSAYFRSTVELEEGTIQLAGEDFDKELRQNFNQGYAPLRPSLVQRWHLSAEPWYYFLLSMPLVFTVLSIVSGRRYPSEWIFFGVAIYGTTAAMLVMTQEPTVRYMVSNAWLTPLILGASVAAIISKRAA